MAVLRVCRRKRGGVLRAALRPVVSGGVAAAFAISFFVAVPDAHAYVVKRTSRGELVHWEERTVDYTFDPSIDTSVPQAASATTRAMVSWSGTVGAPDLHAHSASTASDPPTKPGFDQKNGVFYMAAGWAPAGRALAITVLTYDNGTGRILDADIIVNGSYKFAVLNDASELGATTDKRGASAHPSNTDGITHVDEAQSLESTYDLHHVIAHELGHTLGMNDETERKDALMYRYSSPNDATMRAPASDDIAGLAELYSTKLEASGSSCSGARVTPKKPSVVASTFAMLGTLGFLVFLIMRGRHNRRARLAFVLGAAVAVYALLPAARAGDRSVAQARGLAPGHARAKVLSTTTSMVEGLLKTTYTLAVTACRLSACPKKSEGFAWGGTAGNIRQEVGGQVAPAPGDNVDVSFDNLPGRLAPLTLRIGPQRPEAASVRVLTPAD